MTSLQRAVADLDAHLVTLPPAARAAAEEIVRALAPLVTERRAALNELMSEATLDRVKGVIRPAFMMWASGVDVGAALVAAVALHAPTLRAALEQIPAPAGSP